MTTAALATPLPMSVIVSDPPWVDTDAPTPVSVICPVYNNIELTMDFVFNMMRLVKPPNELIVVANGCTDATLPFLVQMQRAGHNVKPVLSPTNRGFAGGNNLGAREASNPIHIFTSNDVRADGDFITPVVECLARNPHALVGRRLLSHDTGWNTYTTGRGIYLIGFQLESGVKLTIPYLEGWFIAVDSRYCHKNKPANKEQIGGLWDERYYPSDVEDLDISMQAQVNNHLLIQLNLPVVHERTGQTANKMPGGRLTTTLRNQRLFMEKWGLVLP